ncbi:hypothetical protein BLNAU_19835 [Blattamonas nauphoetae]|uniref:Uncharacterized protein n=1 Tax=Blattamonas nauphoetae TaxID=2049346 RepID=A0ABQ9X0H4_9EUKA|nr:hypothetical protein BLNAU_19835 [Blattamonas nauphoetae]
MSDPPVLPPLIVKPPKLVFYYEILQKKLLLCFRLENTTKNPIQIIFTVPNEQQLRFNCEQIVVLKAMAGEDFQNFEVPVIAMPAYTLTLLPPLINFGLITGPSERDVVYHFESQWNIAYPFIIDTQDIDNDITVSCREGEIPAEGSISIRISYKPKKIPISPITTVQLGKITLCGEGIKKRTTHFECVIPEPTQEFSAMTASLASTSSRSIRELRNARSHSGLTSSLMSSLGSRSSRWGTGSDKNSSSFSFSISMSASNADDLSTDGKDVEHRSKRRADRLPSQPHSSPSDKPHRHKHRHHRSSKRKLGSSGSSVDPYSLSDTFSDMASTVEDPRLRKGSSSKRSSRSSRHMSSFGGTTFSDTTGLSTMDSDSILTSDLLSSLNSTTISNSLSHGTTFSSLRDGSSSSFPSHSTSIPSSFSSAPSSSFHTASLTSTQSKFNSSTSSTPLSTIFSASDALSSRLHSTSATSSTLPSSFVSSLVSSSTALPLSSSIPLSTAGHTTSPTSTSPTTMSASHTTTDPTHTPSSLLSSSFTITTEQPQTDTTAAASSFHSTSTSHQPPTTNTNAEIPSPTAQTPTTSTDTPTPSTLPNQKADKPVPKAASHPKRRPDADKDSLKQTHEPVIFTLSNPHAITVTNDFPAHIPTVTHDSLIALNRGYPTTSTETDSTIFPTVTDSLTMTDWSSSVMPSSELERLISEIESSDKVVVEPRIPLKTFLETQKFNEKKGKDKDGEYSTAIVMDAALFAEAKTHLKMSSRGNILGTSDNSGFLPTQLAMLHVPLTIPNNLIAKRMCVFGRVERIFRPNKTSQVVIVEFNRIADCERAQAGVIHRYMGDYRPILRSSDAKIKAEWKKNKQGPVSNRLAEMMKR